MATFGANLRREREMRGVPLEEISAATKIGVRALQALEAEEFSKLPGGIFTRSFIRAYAKYLGLDEETVIGEYQAVAPPGEEADLSRLALSKPKPPKESSRARYLGPIIAVILLAGGYALYRYSRHVAEAPANVSNSSPRAAPPASTAAQPAPSQPVGAVTTPAATAPAPSATETAGQQPTQPPAEAPPGESSPGPQSAAKTSRPSQPVASASSTAAPDDSSLVLQVAASEQSWVAVEADGKTVLQRILRPNDIQTFKANKSFDVMTGNAQGVILTLNGETLKPLGHRGEVKKVHVTRDDLKNLNP